ncbi:TetR/AcrR family transcriptional regulator [Gordonia sp. PP30]|uniref:TetR/AcrR family transcriptional regulator n=1 Tax=Gordonia sp. PP30 TaxID=2935861 RepID=UPI001FFE7B25|nr:TetR/AcrR family transcriptional regulator [Gordonia sp. PP30]UQE76250.1 TetR/AcrR family transcriptional regulator [Gordonia sp. PP30]
MFARSAAWQLRSLLMRPQPQRRARGEARREQIISEALRVFAEHGYRNASAAEIAERCGLSQPGLWHYFPNKDALLTAALAHRDQNDLARFGHDLPLRGADGLRRLVTLIEAKEQAPDLVRLFTVVAGESVTVDHPARDWAVRRHRTMRLHAAAALEGGVANGEFRSGIDIPAIASQVVATIDGLQLQWLLDPEEIELAAVFETYIESLIDCLTVTNDTEETG